MCKCSKFSREKEAHLYQTKEIGVDEEVLGHNDDMADGECQARQLDGLHLDEVLLVLEVAGRVLLVRGEAPVEQGAAQQRLHVQQDCSLARDEGVDSARLGWLEEGRRGVEAGAADHGHEG